MPLFEGFHNLRHLFPKFNPNPNLPLKYIPVILRILIAKHASLLIYESAVIAIIGLTFVSPRLPRNIKCPPIRPSTSCHLSTVTAKQNIPLLT